jgi:hypothetical protein
LLATAWRRTPAARDGEHRNGARHLFSLAGGASLIAPT